MTLASLRPKKLLLFLGAYNHIVVAFGGENREARLASLVALAAERSEKLVKGAEQNLAESRKAEAKVRRTVKEIEKYKQKTEEHRKALFD